MQQLLVSLNTDLFLPYRGEMSTAACLTGLSKGSYYGPFVDADSYYTGPYPKRTIEQEAKDEVSMRIVYEPSAKDEVGLDRLRVYTLACLGAI
jgi:hypothetical protein